MALATKFLYGCLECYIDENGLDLQFIATFADEDC